MSLRLSLRSFSMVSLLALTLSGVAAFVAPPALLSQTTDSPSGTGQPDLPASSGQTGKRGQWLQDLNLTPEQLKQLQAVRQQYSGQLTQKAQNLRQARQEMVQMMSGTATDQQLRAKFDQIEALHQEVTKLRFESMLAMRSLLTPEQRSQFAQKMQQHRQGMRDRGLQNRQNNL
ncbi:MAG: Spy/CpxP family protein refolding chaperone [Aphanocapsa sp. GSE-SYN-MK-11-07L]|jgi:Spy/CpxP family protein refolding chaperone|nr:Spy/CpxP family protein refolding chaperone [Aphanocapsa sp. GSE-SYN-MK-11-07L]